MSTESRTWRARAAADRVAAEVETLPNAKARLIASAEVYERLAEGADRVAARQSAKGRAQLLQS